MNIYLEEGQAPADEMMDKLIEAACCVLDSEGVCKDRAQISLTLISPGRDKEPQQRLPGCRQRD